jgi:hypothetical protein
LEKKLDLILNKLDNMQKSINNLNDHIKKLEEWRAQFMTQDDSNSSSQLESNDLINLNTPNSSSSKRICVSNSSSSDTDNTSLPTSFTVPKPNHHVLINKQSEVIKD